MALGQFDLELDAAEERRWRPEDDPVGARLAWQRARGCARRRRSRRSRSARLRARARRGRRPPARRARCRGRGSKSGHLGESRSLDAVFARDLLLVRVGELAVAHDVLAADEQPVDPMRAREDEARRRGRRRRRARGRRCARSRGRRACRARASRCRCGRAPPRRPVWPGEAPRGRSSRRRRRGRARRGAPA